MLALAGCRQLIGIDEGVVIDARSVEDVAVVDMPIDESPCKDTDADGVCNVDDTWPCGPEPADLPETVIWEETAGLVAITIELTNPTLDSARKLVVAPGASVQLRTEYSIVDCICPACLDQIEVGFVPMGRQGCIYDANPAGSSPATCNNPTTGEAVRSLTAPTVPGAYTLRFRLGQDVACGSDTTWWENTPPPASASAVHVCVDDPDPNPNL